MTESDLLIVRADAGHGIGSGHVMRMIALAEAWRRRGGRCVLVTCSPTCLRERALESFDHVQPTPEANGDLRDAEATVSLARAVARECSSGAPWLALDGYHFTPDFQAAIQSSGFPLLLMDDFAHWPRYHADIIVNQNAGAERYDYSVDGDTRLLRGPEYVLLRDEFLRIDPVGREASAGSARVLVTFGGVDAANHTLTVLRALESLSLPQLQIRVVVGPANAHQDELERFARESRQSIRLVRDARPIAEQLNWAGIAISAAGTTSWELAYLGVPALLISVADNQRDLATHIDRLGIATHLGWHDDLTSETITAAVQGLLSDPALQQRMSERGRSVVDGRGCERVLDMMTSVACQHRLLSEEAL